jgi:predicted MFS family arabinose efflux permease
MSLSPPEIKVEQRRALLGLSSYEWKVVFIGVSAMIVPSVMPAMVGALAGDLGFGAERAGYVASANMGAILAGSLASGVLLLRMSPSLLLIGGLIGMVAGHLLAVVFPSYGWILGARIVSGFGDGIAAAICYAMMGRTQSPSRTIAFYAAGQGLVGAVGMAILPSMIEVFGWRSLFLLVSAVAIPSIFMAGEVAGRLDRSSNRVRGDVAVRLSAAVAAAAASIFLFFVGLAAVWGFMQRIGVDHGFSVKLISTALSASAVASMLGSLVVGVVAYRLSTRVAGLVGLVLLAIGAYCLLTPHYWTFLLAVVALNFLWTFQFPFLFRNFAQADRGGRITSITPAINGFALTVSLAAGGMLLENVGLVALAGFSVVTAAMGLLLATFVHRSS